MIFNSTVIGASHFESGKECQDCSRSWQNRSGSIRIAVVSDGHGGEAFYNSATGAHLACKIALETLKEVAATIKRIPKNKETNLVKSICSSILARWYEIVDAIRGTDSVKSFGCTLIAYLQTSEYWIGIQIGDGKFVIYNEKKQWCQPVPWDDRCILNFTTSMCDENALDEFRFIIGHRTPRAIFLSTDGIDSTFEDGVLLYNFFTHVLNSACSIGIKKIRSELSKALSHFSEIGSKDDMSVAAIINKKIKIVS